MKDEVFHFFCRAIVTSRLSLNVTNKRVQSKMKDEVFHFFYRAKVTTKVYQKVRNHLEGVGLAEGA